MDRALIKRKGPILRADSLRQPQDHIAVAFAGAAQRHEHPMLSRASG